MRAPIVQAGAGPAATVLNELLGGEVIRGEVHVNGQRLDRGRSVVH